MTTTFTTDLLMLTLTAGLCAATWIPYILSTIATRGLVRAVSYPKPDDKPLPEWAQRAHRAHMNLVENIGPLAALILVAHLTQTAGETTALAATIFFWARVVQYICHIFGIPWVRTLAFFVSFFALVAIFLAIFGAA
jgi:uncharacterized MAPEG superfamily protein